MLSTLAAALQTYNREPYAEIVRGLSLARAIRPSTLEGMLYEPLVCLIVQGQKETVVGRERAMVSAGECVVVSHAVPVMARITRATPRTPYLALVATLDVAELRSLYHELDDDGVDESGSSHALSVAQVEPEVLEVLSRYVALANDPTDAQVLANSVRRELHYRLLRGSCGRMLRMLLRRESHASSVHMAIQTLRQDFRRAVEMDQLASSVGMSPSSFYKHFKAVTSTTPLQYQKELRLMEAQRLVRRGEHSISEAAHAVGYQSSSQFSREYSRKFGAPPTADLPPA